jgi:hypothetical protein
MSTSPSSSKLSEEIVATAIAKLKIKDLRAHLESIGWDEEVAAQLLALLRRTNSLVIRHGDLSLMGRRDKFLSAVRDLFRARFGSDADAICDSVFELLARAEDGYARILNSLDGSVFAQLPMADRCAAVISRGAIQVEFVIERVAEHMSDKGVVGTTTTLRNENGRPVNADGAVHEFVEDVGSTLLMEGFRGHLFNTAGELVLPPLPNASEDDIFKAGLNEVGARYWRFWAVMEESARVLNGDLKPLEQNEYPSEIPDGTSLVYQHERSLEPWSVFAARLRQVDRANQNFAELLRDPAIEGMATGIDKPIDLSSGFVSIEEGAVAEVVGI